MQENHVNMYEEVTEDMLKQVSSYKPLIGRQEELDKLVEILNRKEKANPVLLGEAGVGKTAIVEGLAQRIASKDVPTKMHNARLLELKMGRLVAMGQRFGSIEAAVEQFFTEIKETNEHIILFIDEVHTLMEAGKPYVNGIQDYFKPHLARGNVRLIGSTTVAEFKQVERDKAMARRLTPIIVNEPSFEDSVLILEGVKETFEEYHDVEYGEGVLPYILNVTNRYLKERVQPDKGIDYLDLVGAKRNLLYKVPDTTEYDEALLAQVDDMYLNLKAHNMEEAYACQQIIDTVTEQRDAYIQAEQEARQRLITVADVKVILTNHLGVEVDIDTDDQEDVLSLNTLTDRLRSQVIGQEEAVNGVGKVLIHHQLGLRNPEKPVGTFLFYGPSGVGKTELAKQIALEKFGSKDNLLRIDMGEYKEPHKISALLGSPAGYVGYDNGKGAFESLRKKPNQVVLIDEVEKAHPSILDLFLRVLDEGILRDSDNNLINFRETVLIFTTNAKPKKNNMVSIGFGSNGGTTLPTPQQVVRFDQFKPEFLNRFDAIIEFNDMTVEILETIADLRISELNKRYEQLGYTVSFTKPAKSLLAQTSLDKGMGARPLNRNLTKLVEDTMASYLLGGGTSKVFNFGVENGTIVLKPEQQAGEQLGILQQTPVESPRHTQV